MSCPLRALPALLLALASVSLLPGSPRPAAAQGSFRVEVFNTRRELSGELWGAGQWVAFAVDEEERDLNGDKDVEDSVLHLFNIRSLDTTNTGVAIDYSLQDEEENWAVAVSDNLIALQVSELDNGGRDMNGNGTAEDNVLCVYNPLSKQLTSLGVMGGQPRFLNGKLYFVRPEADAKKDLNGDGDMQDAVLCSYDPATRQIDSLGMEAANGYQVAGDWIAVAASEAGQFARDQNLDNDVSDVIAHLYQVSTKKWTSTAWDCSYGMALTPKLLAVGVEEQRQGNRDLNADKDSQDVVAHVWNLAAGTGMSLARDCSGDLVADDDLVGFITLEEAQGNQDLNGDKDTDDEVASSYVLGAAGPTNLTRDASGGIAIGGGKLAFACSEADQANRDLNNDRDTDDYVLMIYDPAKNHISNSGWAVDAVLEAKEGYLAWTVLEEDQKGQDLNRDRDVEDSILFAMDLRTLNIAPTSTAATDYVAITSEGIAFGTPEFDQGNRDLNMDGDTEDEIVQVARFKK
ncbi:MAG: hypothetical protein ACK47B_17790 [Armatimonadota bacterium]